jgi:hypothetical protein
MVHINASALSICAFEIKRYENLIHPNGMAEHNTLPVAMLCRKITFTCRPVYYEKRRPIGGST